MCTHALTTHTHIRWNVINCGQTPRDKRTHIVVLGVFSCESAMGTLSIWPNEGHSEDIFGTTQYTCIILVLLIDDLDSCVKPALIYSCF